MNAKPQGLFQILTHVYKKRHRSGAVTWVVRWKSPTSGKWKTAAAGKTRAEAVLFENKVRYELALGRDPQLLKLEPSGNLTVRAVTERFLEHSRFLTGSDGWRAENKARLKQWVLPNLGVVTFNELTPDVILKFYLKLREDGFGRPSIAKTHTLCA